MTVIDNLILTINPGIFLILGGLISTILPSKIAQKFNIALPLLLLLGLWNTEQGNHFSVLFLGYNLELFRVCLLYTSPSPRDRQKSRMPSSA